MDSEQQRIINQLFFEACIQNNTDTMRKLYKLKPDLNFGPSGVSPLIICSQTGCFNAVYFLVTRGADLEYIGSSQHTPLCSAINAGRTDIVEYLVSQGADISKIPKSVHATNHAKEDILEIIASKSGSSKRKCPTYNS